MNCQYKYELNLGSIWLAEKDGVLTNLKFGDENLKEFEIHESELLKKSAKQLEEYLNGERKYFDLPISAKGTEFQEKVWEILLEIDYGKVCSYKDIAIKLGNENACRAVGMANNKNPLPIIIPCHRVIGKSGKLIGYAGGLDLKKKLIDLESLNSIKFD